MPLKASSAFLSVLLAFPAQAAVGIRTSAKNAPYFSAVQVLTDPRTMEVSQGFLDRFRLHDMAGAKVFEAPDARERRVLAAEILPAAARTWDQSGAPRWFEFAPVRAAEGLTLAPEIEGTMARGKETPRAMRQLGELLRVLHENIRDPEVLPIVVANTFLFEPPKRGKKDLAKSAIAGQAVYPDGIRKIQRETGMTLPERPAILIANNPWIGGFYEDTPQSVRRRSLLLAHEIGHIPGLTHSRAAYNIMRPSREEFEEPYRFDRNQITWLRRWLELRGSPAAVPAAALREGSLGHRVLLEAYALASQGKGDVRFGAVLVDKDGRIIGRGRNRLSEKGQRAKFNGIDWKARAPVAAGIQAPHRMLEGNLDYAIHAEQDAIADALRRGKSVRGATIYALGVRKDGLVGRRAATTWTCRRCAVWIEYFGLKNSMELTRAGWESMDAAELYPAAARNGIRGKDFWNKQQRGVRVAGVQNYEWVRLEDLLVE